jgi:hypothetical protein
MPSKRVSCIHISRSFVFLTQYDIDEVVFTCDVCALSEWCRLSVNDDLNNCCELLYGGRSLQTEIF